jgi:hypothetical protein
LKVPDFNGEPSPETHTAVDVSVFFFFLIC